MNNFNNKTFSDIILTIQEQKLFTNKKLMKKHSFIVQNEEKIIMIDEEISNNLICQKLNNNDFDDNLNNKT